MSMAPAPLAALVLFFWCMGNAVQEKPVQAGSGQCQRCHEDIYAEWSNNPAHQSCETCHGNGVRHVLAPTPANITRISDALFSHGPKNAPVRKKNGIVTLDLFIMSYCPYGIAAVNELLPLLRAWKKNIVFNLYFIAHARDGEQEAEEPGQPLPEGASVDSKCQASGNMEGTDRFVSLHGLNEVLEDMRQTVIAAFYPDKLLDYLRKRNQDIDSDWRKAARTAGFSAPAISAIAAYVDSRKGDSLFTLNIREAKKRKVNGSPTLFINGVEYEGAITAYPVERFFCDNAPRTGPCVAFPECGYDTDCRQAGKSGVCRDPMTKKARCVFTKARSFTVTVVNDESCPTCHTGNIIMEIRRRFPEARFDFIDINATRGKETIAHYGLAAYPAFLFDSAVTADPRFAEISATFTPAGNKLRINQSVVKSYHLLSRIRMPGRLEIMGSFQDPPFVEMLRSFETVIFDSLPATLVVLHPYAYRAQKKTREGEWTNAFQSLNGPGEIRESSRQLCVFALYPKRKAYDYALCRGFDVQQRFETRTPEPADEWHACAHQLDIDTVRIRACSHSKEGETLFSAAVALSDSVFNTEPTVSFLVNNTFKIAGYNPAILKVIISELKGLLP